MSLNDTDLELFIYMYKHGYKVNELLDIFKISMHDFKLIVKSYNLNSPNKQKKQGDLYFCPKCKLYKPKENFYKSIRNAHGIQSYCIPCNKLYQKKKLKPLILKSKQEVEKSNLKYCSKCKTLKDVDLFNWKIKNKKLLSVCKECDRTRIKDLTYKLLEKRGY